ncbi:cell division protein FtsA [Halalkalibacter wakoensis JCM 9140]|uniref:Cell division protein FtsA n=1 Tax=Halalkalibacter wakoensis JCM 9140 TaxID=1236970 RepID=W4Q250_9BACI|nr:cell division protein FtsA [Halalkalibacter wakoensis]GAE25813.1 cell division protein FtsA [Halalkalibacter wakoensis JCM 9140]
MSADLPLFALDIGTRTVVGLLLQPNDGTYQLIDKIVKEHDERAMLDGQIHDVPAVAKVIQQIKNSLEAKHGPLKKVCVAAAGRSLKTKRSQMTVDIETKPMLTRDDLLHLELSAVQNAQFLLANEEANQSAYEYYCVGYSVLAYRLDGEIIGSLLDQSGKEASVEVIATFLPKVVVESLLAALARADLELEALTLEPIAAINVLIPPSMRRLNVALVDIGAGTSDIALTAENTIIAYGMVPVAGDEITEAISDSYLLDFPDAEKVKRDLLHQDSVSMIDILGNEILYEKTEVEATIEASIRQLAKSITDEILHLNGQAPQAVMLVGGGSLTPNLPQFIQEYLGLASNRVAIRGADAIKLLDKNAEEVYGPELVTPIGIAIAAKENPIEYISIIVNNRTLRLFDVKKLTVGDGLLAAGIDIAKLYGKPGLALMVTVFGKLISIPGQHGGPPILLKNDQPTSLDAPLEANDCLHVQRGQDGESSTITIKDLLGDIPSKQILLNNELVELPITYYINNQEVSADTIVAERNVITTKNANTLRDLLQYKGYLSYIRPITVTVNEENWTYTNHLPDIFVNGKKQSLDYVLANHDNIEMELKHSSSTIQDLLLSKGYDTQWSIRVTYNGEPLVLTKNTVDVFRNEQPVSLDEAFHPNDSFTFKTKNNRSFILQDLFSFIEINIASLVGKRLSIKINGDEASFSSPLSDKDQVDISVIEVSKT